MIRKNNKRLPTQLHRWHGDVIRLQQVMYENGYDADYDDAANIWEEYSDDLAAGWIGLPEEDGELWELIEHRVKRASL